MDLQNSPLTSLALPERPARISGALVLGAVFALLTFIGAFQKWLAFPITAPVNADQLMFGTFPVSAGHLLLALLLLGLLSFYFSRGLASLILLGALVLLLRVPLEVAAYQPDWHLAFLVQVADRLDMAKYLLVHNAINLSPEPTLVPLDRINGTDDQLRLGFLVLAWPWYLAFGACVGLFCTIMSRWQSTYRIAWTVVTAVVLVAAFLFPPLWALEKAQAVRDTGSRRLSAGEGVRALVAFREAYKNNPGLIAARTFWIEVAAAYAQASGGHHTYAALVAPLALSAQRVPGKDASVYGEAAYALATLTLPSPADDLEAGLQRVSALVRDQFFVRQALILDEAGKNSAATVALLRVEAAETSLARFYLADLTMRQGGYLQAVEMLRALDAHVSHPTVRADINCSLGDALTGMGRLVDARSAYLACKDLDDITNYRVTKALGGT